MIQNIPKKIDYRYYKTFIEKLIFTLKEKKVEYYKTSEVEIRFSPLAFIPTATESAPTAPQIDEDSDDLLYYSAQPRRPF